MIFSLTNLHKSLKRTSEKPCLALFLEIKRLPSPIRFYPTLKLGKNVAICFMLPEEREQRQETSYSAAGSRPSASWLHQASPSLTRAAKMA